MGIGQGDPSDIGLADVADDVFGFDGIALDQLGNGRAVTGRRIMEAAHPAPLVEGHSPAVAMRTGTPTALHQPGKAETDIRGYIGAHAHQFTHSVTPPTKPRDFRWSVGSLVRWSDWSTFKGMVLQNLLRDRQEPALRAPNHNPAVFGDESPRVVRTRTLPMMAVNFLVPEE